MLITGQPTCDTRMLVGWIFVALPVLAAAMFGTGRTAPFWISLGVAFVAFWSLGIMHNFASKYRTPQAAPEWATSINMFATVAGIVLFIWALIVRF